MKVEYIKNLSGSFMILKDAEYEYENYELLMLLNNPVPGCLETQIIIGDGKVEYWYDITGMTALDTLLGNQNLGAKQMRRIVGDLFDMNLKLEEYLLDGNNICYLPEFIYLERASGKYKFCYLPGSGALGTMCFQNLMENLLTKIDHTDQEAVKIGYDLYEKSTQECCSAEELLMCVTVLEPLKEEESGLEFIEEPESVEPNQVEEVWEENRPGPLEGIRQLFLGKGGRHLEEMQRESVLQESIVYEEHRKKHETGKSTILLDMEQSLVIGRLMYQGKGGEADFLLEDDLFLIGTDSEKVTGVMRAPSVSRIHARIIKREGRYFLEDLNSTNGTYLNGKELAYHEPMRLKKGDVICFASEEYVFH